MVHSHILSRLDYCNVLLVGISATQIKKLQKVLNAAIRYIFNLNKRQSVHSYGKTCHFLPVKFRIFYKSCLTVYKTLYNLAPAYLEELAQPMLRNRDNLRSELDYLLLQYPNSSKTLRYYLVNNWNSLPFELRCIPTIERFKSSLKTFCFNKAYN